MSIQSIRWSAAAVLLIALAAGCSKDPVSTGGDDDTQYRMSYVRDYEYVQRIYYDVGKFGADSLGNCFTVGQDTIIDFKLFIAGTRGTPGDAFALITVDPRDLNAYPKNIFSSYAHELTEGEDYFLNPNGFWIRFPQPLPHDEILACWMVVGTPAGRVEIGNIETDIGKPRYFKMLKAPIPYPGSPTWDYQWRNVYDLGVTDFIEGDIKVDVYYGAPGAEDDSTHVNHQAGIPYLQLFGLDICNRSGQRKPDGKVDFIAEILDPDMGHLIFRNRKPFAPIPDTAYCVAHPDERLTETFPKLYTTSNITFIKDESMYYIGIGVAEEEPQE